MKNFIFSAVAMIAFVGSSRAGSVEIKDQIVVQVVKSCEEKAMDYVDGMNGLSSMEAYYPYTGYLNACNAAKKKSISAN